MCRTDFDEGWLVDVSWRAVGKCVDCGWFGPGIHEVYVPDDADIWADEAAEVAVMVDRSIAFLRASVAA